METLGVNLLSLITQIINFLILFFILKKFVFQIIIDMITKERKQIKETAKFQQEIADERQNLSKLKADQLVNSRKEASEMITKAKFESDRIKKSATAEVDKKVKRLIQEAKEETTSLRVQMKKKMDRQIIELAKKLAAKIIEENLNSAKQQGLINKALNNLKKAEL